jgi:hypothetical protein
MTIPKPDSPVLKWSFLDTILSGNRMVPTIQKLDRKKNDKTSLNHFIYIKESSLYVYIKWSRLVLPFENPTKGDHLKTVNFHLKGIISTISTVHTLKECTYGGPQMMKHFLSGNQISSRSKHQTFRLTLNQYQTKGHEPSN